MVPKYIESYGKHALAVNQRHGGKPKAPQEAILCFTYFMLIENGLLQKPKTTSGIRNKQHIWPINNKT